MFLNNLHSETYQLISDKYMLYLANLKENFCPYAVEKVVQPIQPILDGGLPERMPSEEWQTGPEGDETEQPDDGGGQDRDVKTYQCANNVGVKKILSWVKCVQNITLFCRERE